MLKQATDAGFKPDLHTYTTLIKGAVRKDDLDAAVSVYRDMLSAKVEPSAVRHACALACHTMFCHPLLRPSCL